MTPTLLTASYAGNYSLRLRFGDGVEGEVDLAHSISDDLFLPLRDLTFFQQFRLDRTCGPTARHSRLSFFMAGWLNDISV
jgi:hypothetical protein